MDDYAVKADYRNDHSAVWRVSGKEVDETIRTKALRPKNLEIFPTRIKSCQAE